MQALSLGTIRKGIDIPLDSIPDKNLYKLFKPEGDADNPILDTLREHQVVDFMSISGLEFIFSSENYLRNSFVHQILSVSFYILQHFFISPMQQFTTKFVAITEQTLFYGKTLKESSGSILSPVIVLFSLWCFYVNADEENAGFKTWLNFLYTALFCTSCLFLTKNTIPLFQIHELQKMRTSLADYETLYKDTDNNPIIIPIFTLDDSNNRTYFDLFAQAEKDPTLTNSKYYVDTLSLAINLKKIRQHLEKEY